MQRKNASTLKDLCKNVILSDLFGNKKGIVQCNGNGTDAYVKSIQDATLTSDLKEELIADVIDSHKLATLDTESLFKLCLESVDTALKVLSTESLCNKLGMYDRAAVRSIKERAPIGYTLSKSQTGEYLFEIGKAHAEAAKYILGKLSNKISLDQKSGLENNVATKESPRLG